MSNNYDKTNIASMEMIYGEGYLSAGGDEDVARILDGLDVSGKQILAVVWAAAPSLWRGTMEHGLPGWILTQLFWRGRMNWWKRQT